MMIDTIKKPGLPHGGTMLRPEILLIHFISNPEQARPFTLQACYDVMFKYGVSANYLMGREGLEDGEIWELVPPNVIAYHAGKSAYNGITGLNHASIGFEWIGNDKLEFTDLQYNQGSDLVVQLIHEYPSLSPKHIKGHQIVSDRTVRKDPKPDPGRMFDWIRFGHDVMRKL